MLTCPFYVLLRVQVTKQSSASYNSNEKVFCVETYFKEVGQGKPIVYLHGWGADGSIFASTAALLPNYRNIMLDFAGFGLSPPPPPQGFNVFDYANQLADFLTSANLAKVTIVAHSFGCRVAMAVSALRPDLADRVLLFAPAGLRRKSFMRWCKVRYYKACKRLCPRRAERFASDDYKNAPPYLRNTFVKVVNYDLSQYARCVKCKTLIVAARGDTAVPLRDAKRLNKLISNSEFAQVNGDHFALFYAPAAFAEIIRLFVEE